MASLVLLFYIYQLFFHSVYSVTNQANVTTSSPSNNGASVSVLKDTTTTGGKWLITASDQIGFHIKLSMDSLYAFHSTEISTLTISIGSDTATGGSDHDLLVSFTQSSSKYVSYELSIDNMYGHVMYPVCDTTSSYHSFAAGNIEALCNANSGTREAKVTNNGAYGYFGPQPANTGYPLKFTIENHPDSHTFVTYSDPNTSPVTCGFSPAFDANVPLEVFFATEDDGEEFAITYIDITYNDPSSLTTTSSSPTSHPTAQPTTNPSFGPSQDPSSDPTQIPTKNPTKTPSLIPSETPSLIPTKRPSLPPSPSPISVNEAEVAEFEPSTTEEENGKEDENEREEVKDKNNAILRSGSFLLFGVLALCVCISCCSILLIWFFIKKICKYRDVDASKPESVELENITNLTRVESVSQQGQMAPGMDHKEAATDAKHMVADPVINVEFGSLPELPQALLITDDGQQKENEEDSCQEGEADGSDHGNTATNTAGN